MSLSAPLFLLGLLALPVLWILHRMRRRQPPIEIPSLLFLEDELEGKPPRRRFFDLDLLLAGLGTTLLVLAASGPALVEEKPGRSLRVVVSGGAPLSSPKIAANTDAALEAIRAAMAPTDRLRTVEAPPGRRPDAKRPTADELVQLALAGEGAWRAVLSDRPPPSDLTTQVAWIQVGVLDATNAGIVRVGESEDGGRRMLWALLHAAPAQDVALELRQGTARAASRVHVEGFRSIEMALPGRGTFELRIVDAEDDLPADDRVRVADQELRVRLDVPAPQAEAVRAALRAAPGRFVEVEDRPTLLVTTTDGDAPDDAWRLVLHPTGEAASFAPEGPDQRLPDPLVRDLSSRGADLAYGVRPREGGGWLLWRDPTWPIVSRAGRTVTFWPDPVAGQPSPGQTPLWPLFLDNLRASILGEHGARGLLDADTSRLGRERTELATLPAQLAPVVPDLPEKRRPLRLPVAIAGLLLWLVLWLRPRSA